MVLQEEEKVQHNHRVVLDLDEQSNVFGNAMLIVVRVVQ